MRQSKVDNNFVISPMQIQKLLRQEQELLCHAGTGQTAHDRDPRRLIGRRAGRRQQKGIGGRDPPEGRQRRGVRSHGADVFGRRDSTQQAGGDWGWIERNTLNEKLTNVAFSLRPGEVSPVLDIENTYYILTVDAKRSANVKPIGEVRDEIEKNLIQQERRRPSGAGWRRSGKRHTSKSSPRSGECRDHLWRSCRCRAGDHPCRAE